MGSAEQGRLRRFEDKVVVITGASAGVGRAMAHAFARAGASLGLIARDEESLEEVKADLPAPAEKLIAIPLDVADANAVFAAAERVERELGPIDVWINNAMLTVFSPFMKIEPDSFRRVTEVTYLGYVYGTMAALRQMRPRNRGTIIQIGSALAYRAMPLQTACCGAKHAIRGFTDGLRAELIHEHSGISLTMVQLPAVNTPQFDWSKTNMAYEPRPAGAVVQPEAVANALVKIADKPSREYWLGLSSIAVIPGNMLAPGLVDRYLSRSAVGGQKRREPALPDRPHNLHDPVTGLHTTHGSFDHEAKSDVLTLSGRAARLSILAGASAVLFSTGFLLSRLTGSGTTRRMRRRQRRA